LQIKPAEHERLMTALEAEQRALLTDPSRQLSAEQRLQRDAYARALQRQLGQVLEAEPSADEEAVRQLRREYGITPQEHQTILGELLGHEPGLAERLSAAVGELERAAQTIQALEAEPSPSRRFVVELLQRLQGQVADRLLSGVWRRAETGSATALHDGLLGDEAARHAAVEELCGSLPASAASRLVAAQREVAEWAARAPLAERVRAYVQAADPYLRAAALHLLAELNELTEATLRLAHADEHAVPRRAAEQLLERGTGAGVGRGPMTTLEKMIALRAVPVFALLAPESLAILAGASSEVEFEVGQTLCREGEAGSSVFVLLAGQVEIRRRVAGADVVIDVEGPGSVIGELAVIDPAPRAATVRVVGSTLRTLHLDGQPFQDALTADPTASLELARTLARRLRVARPPSGIIRPRAEDRESQGEQAARIPRS